MAAEVVARELNKSSQDLEQCGSDAPLVAFITFVAVAVISIVVVASEWWRSFRD